MIQLKIYIQYTIYITHFYKIIIYQVNCVFRITLPSYYNLKRLQKYEVRLKNMSLFLFFQVSTTSTLAARFLGVIQSIYILFYLIKSWKTRSRAVSGAFNPLLLNLRNLRRRWFLKIIAKIIYFIAYRETFISGYVYDQNPNTVTRAVRNFWCSTWRSFCIYHSGNDEVSKIDRRCRRILTI